MCAWKGLLPWMALWRTTGMAHTQPRTQPVARAHIPLASQMARRPSLIPSSACLMLTDASCKASPLQALIRVLVSKLKSAIGTPEQS